MSVLKKSKKDLFSSKTLSLIIIIASRNKADYYIDLMEEYKVNMQLVVNGNGTTKNATFLTEVGSKAMICGVITEDYIKKALETLKEKFVEVRDGKGIAFTVPLTSVMGVHFFNFLSNNRDGFIKN